MIGEGYELLSLDIENAFNSVPHGMIRTVLTNAGVHPVMTEYIMKFLCSRFCILDVSSDSG